VAKIKNSNIGYFRRFEKEEKKGFEMPYQG